MSTQPSATGPSRPVRRIAAAKAAWEAFPAGSFNPTQPDASKLATVGTWLESSVLPTWESWQTNLVALGAPASGSAAWDAVVAGVKDTVDLEHAQIAAAQAGDPAAFAATTARLQASHIKFLVDTKTAGVDACGDIVRS